MQRADKYLSEKVKIILSQKAAGIETTDLEKEIDLIVCKLYSLTYEEASVVEGNEIWMKKEEYEEFVLE